MVAIWETTSLAGLAKRRHGPNGGVAARPLAAFARLVSRPGSRFDASEFNDHTLKDIGLTRFELDLLSEN